MPLRPAMRPSHVLLADEPSGVMSPRPVMTTRRRSPFRTEIESIEASASSPVSRPKARDRLQRLQRGDLRRLDERGAREQRERDRDEPKLEAREAEVAQPTNTDEAAVAEPLLPPERRVREDRGEQHVREELRHARMREEDARVERRDARARDEERERVRPERDAEANQPRPRREVRERDRTDAVQAREGDHAEAEARVPHEESERDAGRVGPRVERRKHSECEARGAFRQERVRDAPGERERHKPDRAGGCEPYERAVVVQRAPQERPGDQGMTTLP